MRLTGELGRSGILIGTLGMDRWTIRGPFWEDGVLLGWGEIDDRESICTLHCALDKGISFFYASDPGISDSRPG